MIRTTIYFSGHVQGVGFRFTTRLIAMNYTVSGFVRNLANGQVELVVEGNQSEVDSFLSDLRQRMAENIDNEQVDNLPATGEFTHFEIR